MTDTPATALFTIDSSDAASDAGIISIGASDAFIVAVDDMTTTTFSTVSMTSNTA